MNITIYLIDEIERACALGHVELKDDDLQDMSEIRAAAAESPDSGARRLRSFFETHHSVAIAVGKCLVREAIRFIDNELNSYKELQLTRPLTESEKRYVQHELGALVNSVVALCRSGQ